MMAKTGNGIASSFGNYFKNVAKSTAYLTRDVVGAQIPEIADAIDVGLYAADVVFDSIANFDTISQKLVTSVKTSKVGRDIGNIVKNAVEDVKTGKFYNDDRMNSENSFGYNLKAEEDMFRRSSSLDVGLTRAQMMNDDKNSNIDRVLSSRQHAESMQVGVAVNSNIANLVTTMNDKMLPFMEDSINYMNDSMNVQNNILGVLQDINDNMIEQFKMLYQTEKNEKTMSDKGYGKLFNDEGGFNFSEVIEKLKENVKKNYIEPVLSNFFDFEGNSILSEIASNPIGFALSVIADQAIPYDFKESAYDLRRVISSASIGIFEKLKQKSVDDPDSLFSGLFRNLTDGFGEVKKSYDTTAYEKGPISFDGVTKKAVTHVIPSLLSKIYSAIIGAEDELVADYDNGGSLVWIKDLKASQEKLIKESGDSNFKDILYKLDMMLDANAKYNPIDMDKETAKIFKQRFRDIFNFIKDDDKMFDPKSEAYRERLETQFGNDGIAGKFLDMINLLPNADAMSILAAMGRAKREKDSLMWDFQNKAQTSGMAQANASMTEYMKNSGIDLQQSKYNLEALTNRRLEMVDERIYDLKDYGADRHVRAEAELLYKKINRGENIDVTKYYFMKPEYLETLKERNVLEQKKEKETNEEEKARYASEVESKTTNLKNMESNFREEMKSREKELANAAVVKRDNLFLKSIDNIYNLLSKGIKVFSVDIDPENHEKLSEPAKIKERMIVDGNGDVVTAKTVEKQSLEDQRPVVENAKINENAPTVDTTDLDAEFKKLKLDRKLNSKEVYKILTEEGITRDRNTEKKSFIDALKANFPGNPLVNALDLIAYAKENDVVGKATNKIKNNEFISSATDKLNPFLSGITDTIKEKTGLGFDALDKLNEVEDLDKIIENGEFESKLEELGITSQNLTLSIAKHSLESGIENFTDLLNSKDAYSTIISTLRNKFSAIDPETNKRYSTAKIKDPFTGEEIDILDLIDNTITGGGLGLIGKFLADIPFEDDSAFRSLNFVNTIANGGNTSADAIVNSTFTRDDAVRMPKEKVIKMLDEADAFLGNFGLALPRELKEIRDDQGNYLGIQDLTEDNLVKVIDFVNVFKAKDPARELGRYLRDNNMDITYLDKAEQFKEIKNNIQGYLDQISFVDKEKEPGKRKKPKKGSYENMGQAFEDLLYSTPLAGFLHDMETAMNTSKEDEEVDRDKIIDDDLQYYLGDFIEPRVLNHIRKDILLKTKREVSKLGFSTEFLDEVKDSDFITSEVIINSFYKSLDKNYNREQFKEGYDKYISKRNQQNKSTKIVDGKEVTDYSNVDIKKSAWLADEYDNEDYYNRLGGKNARVKNVVRSVASKFDIFAPIRDIFDDLMGSGFLALGSKFDDLSSLITTIIYGEDTPRQDELKKGLFERMGERTTFLESIGLGGSEYKPLAESLKDLKESFNKNFKKKTEPIRDFFTTDNDMGFKKGVKEVGGDLLRFTKDTFEDLTDVVRGTVDYFKEDVMGLEQRKLTSKYLPKKFNAKNTKGFLDGAVDKFGEYAPHAGKGLVGAGIGGLAGLLLPGPALAYLTIGSLTAMAKETGDLDKFLFGDSDKKKGFLPKSWQNALKKHDKKLFKKGSLNKIAGGAAVGGAVTAAFAGANAMGLIPHFFMPGGLIGGALLGAGYQLVKNSEALQEILFGDKDLFGNRTGGIIPKALLDKWPAMKKWGTVGLIASYFLPGGPVLHGVLGALGGALGGTDTLKRILWGNYDPNKNIGSKGLIGETLDIVQRRVLNPFIVTMKQTFSKAAITKENYYGSFNNSFKNLFQSLGTLVQVYAKDTIADIGKRLKKTKIGGAIASKIEKLFTPISKLFSGFTRGVGKIFNGLFAAPGKLMDKVSEWAGKEVLNRIGNGHVTEEQANNMAEMLETIDAARTKQKVEQKTADAEAKRERRSIEADNIRAFDRRDGSREAEELYNQKHREAQKIIDNDKENQRLDHNIKVAKSMMKLDWYDPKDPRYEGMASWEAKKKAEAYAKTPEGYREFMKRVNETKPLVEKYEQQKQDNITRILNEYDKTLEINNLNRVTERKKEIDNKLDYDPTEADLGVKFLKFAKRKSESIGEKTDSTLKFFEKNKLSRVFGGDKLAGKLREKLQESTFSDEIQGAINLRQEQIANQDERYYDPLKLGYDPLLRFYNWKLKNTKDPVVKQEWQSRIDLRKEKIKAKTGYNHLHEDNIINTSMPEFEAHYPSFGKKEKEKPEKSMIEEAIDVAKETANDVVEQVTDRDNFELIKGSATTAWQSMKEMVFGSREDSITEQQTIVTTAETATSAVVAATQESTKQIVTFLDVIKASVEKVVTEIQNLNKDRNKDEANSLEEEIQKDAEDIIGDANNVEGAITTPELEPSNKENDYDYGKDSQVDRIFSKPEVSVDDYSEGRNAEKSFDFDFDSEYESNANAPKVVKQERAEDLATEVQNVGGTIIDRNDGMSAMEQRALKDQDTLQENIALIAKNTGDIDLNTDELESMGGFGSSKKENPVWEWLKELFGFGDGDGGLFGGGGLISSLLGGAAGGGLGKALLGGVKGIVGKLGGVLGTTALAYTGYNLFQGLTNDNDYEAAQSMQNVGDVALSPSFMKKYITPTLQAGGNALAKNADNIVGFLTDKLLTLAVRLKGAFPSSQIDDMALAVLGKIEKIMPNIVTKLGGAVAKLASWAWVVDVGLTVIEMIGIYNNPNEFYGTDMPKNYFGVPEKLTASLLYGLDKFVFFGLLGECGATTWLAETIMGFLGVDTSMINKQQELMKNFQEKGNLTKDEAIDLSTNSSIWEAGLNKWDEWWGTSVGDKGDYEEIIASQFLAYNYFKGIGDEENAQLAYNNMDQLFRKARDERIEIDTDKVKENMENEYVVDMAVSKYNIPEENIGQLETVSSHYNSDFLTFNENGYADYTGDRAALVKLLINGNAFNPSLLKDLGFKNWSDFYANVGSVEGEAVTKPEWLDLYEQYCAAFNVSPSELDVEGIDEQFAQAVIDGKITQENLDEVINNHVYKVNKKTPKEIIENYNDVNDASITISEMIAKNQQNVQTVKDSNDNMYDPDASDKMIIDAKAGDEALETLNQFQEGEFDYTQLSEKDQKVLKEIEKNGEHNPWIGVDNNALPGLYDGFYERLEEAGYPKEKMQWWEAYKVYASLYGVKPDQIHKIDWKFKRDYELNKFTVQNIRDVWGDYKIDGLNHESLKNKAMGNKLDLTWVGRTYTDAEMFDKVGTDTYDAAVEAFKKEYGDSYESGTNIGDAPTVEQQAVTAVEPQQLGEMQSVYAPNGELYYTDGTNYFDTNGNPVSSETLQVAGIDPTAMLNNNPMSFNVPDIGGYITEWDGFTTGITEGYEQSLQTAATDFVAANEGFFNTYTSDLNTYFENTILSLETKLNESNEILANPSNTEPPVALSSNPSESEIALAVATEINKGAMNLHNTENAVGGPTEDIPVPKTRVEKQIVEKPVYKDIDYNKLSKSFGGAMSEAYAKSHAQDNIKAGIGGPFTISMPVVGAGSLANSLLSNNKNKNNTTNNSSTLSLPNTYNSSSFYDRNLDDVKGADTTYNDIVKDSVQNAINGNSNNTKSSSPSSSPSSDTSSDSSVLKKGTWELPLDKAGHAYGQFTSTYGQRYWNGKWSHHNGVDIDTGTGDKVYSIWPGKVRMAQTGYNGGYGSTVWVDHDNGLSSLYGHQHNILVKEGERVRAGQQIGESGGKPSIDGDNAGSSSGDHLHFTLFKRHGTTWSSKNGEDIDPAFIWNSSIPVPSEIADIVANTTYYPDGSGDGTSGTGVTGADGSGTSGTGADGSSTGNPLTDFITKIAGIMQASIFGESYVDPSSTAASTPTSSDGSGSNINVTYDGKLGDINLVDFAYLGSRKENFLEAVQKGAVNNYLQGGILPSVTMAQAIGESGWGESGLATTGKALFGIKAGSNWTGKTWSGSTLEYYNSSNPTSIVDNFRAYDSWDESIADHGRLMKTDRYKAALQLTDRAATIQAIKNGGYATDPNYVNKILQLINDNDLSAVDTAAMNPVKSSTTPQSHVYSAYENNESNPNINRGGYDIGGPEAGTNSKTGSFLKGVTSFAGTAAKIGLTKLFNAARGPIQAKQQEIQQFKAKARGGYDEDFDDVITSPAKRYETGGDKGGFLTNIVDKATNFVKNTWNALTGKDKSTSSAPTSVTSVNNNSSSHVYSAYDTTYKSGNGSNSSYVAPNTSAVERLVTEYIPSKFNDDGVADGAATVTPLGNKTSSPIKLVEDTFAKYKGEMNKAKQGGQGGPDDSEPTPKPRPINNAKANNLGSQLQRAQIKAGTENPDLGGPVEEIFNKTRKIAEENKRQSLETERNIINQTNENTERNLNQIRRQQEINNASTQNLLRDSIERVKSTVSNYQNDVSTTINSTLNTSDFIKGNLMNNDNSDNWSQLLSLMQELCSNTNDIATNTSNIDANSANMISSITGAQSGNVNIINNNNIENNKDNNKASQQDVSAYVKNIFMGNSGSDARKNTTNLLRNQVGIMARGD